MNKNNLFTVIVLLSLPFFNHATIINSITPLIERYECLDNLPKNKFSSSQYSEIEANLKLKNERIRIVSYNMLFNLYDNKLEFCYQWPQRIKRIVTLIEEMQPDVLGSQELFNHQLSDIMPFLKDTYHVYSEQDDNAIFYRKNRFLLLNSQTWIMKESADQKFPRVCAMVLLEDKQTHKKLAFFNTHLSFGEINQRDFEGRFIKNLIETYIVTNHLILAGDFNTFPPWLNKEKLPFYDGEYIQRLLTEKSLQNSYYQSLLGHLGPLSSFTNKEEDVVPFSGTGTSGIFLDHLFVSKHINVIIHATQPATVDGFFPSDHLPIIIDVVLE